MFKVDEDALICDLAETYGLYDYRILPPVKVAVFACGLKDGARIVRKLKDQKYSYSELMDAALIDRMNLLCWLHSKDAQHGTNRPESLVKKMLEPPKRHRLTGENSVEDFMKWRQRFVEG